MYVFVIAVFIFFLQNVVVIFVCRLQLLLYSYGFALLCGIFRNVLISIYQTRTLERQPTFVEFGFVRTKLAQTRSPTYAHNIFVALKFSISILIFIFISYLLVEGRKKTNRLAASHY